MTIQAKPLTSDVFTPTTPARLTFVEREEINNKLVNALNTPGKQIVVYGHSGSGKSTLLENKLHQTYEKHITSRCIKGLSFDHLMLNAFDQLAPFYDAERSVSNKKKVASSFSTEYMGIKAQIGTEREHEASLKQQRILPPQLTPQSLAMFLGEAGCCWVLEDFHKADPSEKTKLAQVMKVFMDMADEYRTLRIIAVGAVDTARQVIEADAEMKNRVSEILVPLMTGKETRQIIEKGELLLNFSVHRNVRSGIVDYSNGLAAVCHQLCLNICFAAGIFEALDEPKIIDTELLEKALESYFEEASDTLKSAFDRAFRKKGGGKFENGRLVLQALAEANQEGELHGELLGRIRASHTDYPSSNLTHYLRELQRDERGALIRSDSSSGKYAFSDPVFRVYAMVLFQKSKSPLKLNFTTSPSDAEYFTKVLRESLSKRLESIHSELLSHSFSMLEIKEPPNSG